MKRESICFHINRRSCSYLKVAILFQTALLVTCLLYHFPSVYSLFYSYYSTCSFNTFLWKQLLNFSSEDQPFTSSVLMGLEDTHSTHHSRGQLGTLTWQIRVLHSHGPLLVWGWTYQTRPQKEVQSKQVLAFFIGATRKEDQSCKDVSLELCLFSATIREPTWEGINTGESRAEKQKDQIQSSFFSRPEAGHSCL